MTRGDISAYDRGVLVSWSGDGFDGTIRAQSQEVLHNPSLCGKEWPSCSISRAGQGVVSTTEPRFAESSLLFSWGLTVATRWQHIWVLCFHCRLKVVSGPWGFLLKNGGSRLRVTDILNYQIKRWRIWACMRVSGNHLFWLLQNAGISSCWELRAPLCSWVALAASLASFGRRAGCFPGNRNARAET